MWTLSGTERVVSGTIALGVLPRAVVDPDACGNRRPDPGGDGVKPSYSRPRVSDDNAYAEALFRTAKYRPEFPAKGFADLEQARTWAAGFVRWYNHDHRHSGIRYVSPAQRHAGEDRTILAARHELYIRARALNPARWSGRTRNWSPIGAVTLNPERDSIVQTHSEASDLQPLAA